MPAQKPLRHRRCRGRLRAGQDRLPAAGEKAHRHVRQAAGCHALGNSDEEAHHLAGRFARMEHRLSATDERQIIQASGGLTLKDLSHRLLDAINPDKRRNIPPFDKGGG